MKFLRNRIVARAYVSFLLLLFIESTFFPTLSFALTGGPHMPEYTSYESSGATDMVNLSTGDFTFSLPILEVPGPEGSFALPLTYNAGIGLEQEASWVGLGWTMNPGAITRTISGFPDDANGEVQSVTVQDLIGLRGWNTNAIAIGNFGWNNQQGHYGNVSILSIINAGWGGDYSQWGGGSSYVGIIGINVGNTGVFLDPVQFAFGAITIASWGAAGVAAGAGNFAIGASKAIAIGAVTSVAMSGLTSLASGSLSPNSPTDGYWEYSKREKKDWGLKVLSGGMVHLNEYKVWLDQTRTEQMFGTMYLGNAPTEAFYSGSDTSLGLKVFGVTRPLNKFSRSSAGLNEGAASDINYLPDPNNAKQFYEVNNPVILSTDNFVVRAPGISGSILPYRLDIGSVAMPREMTSNHDRLAPVSFLSNDPNLPNSNTNFKVPYLYKGQQGNSYFHHVGGLNGVTSPTFYFGLGTNYTNDVLNLELNDVTFDSQRIKSNTPSSRRIPSGEYIEWLSNDEIRNGITYSSKFIDFLSGGSTVTTTSDRYLFRTKTSTTGSGPYTTSHTSSFSHLAIPVGSSFDINQLNGATVNLYVSFYNDQTNSDNGFTNDYQEFTNLQVHSINAAAKTFRIDNSALYPYENKIADLQIKVITNPQSPIGFGNPTSLGGFCITASDGLTYHFALPIYDYDQTSEMREIANPTTRKSKIKRSQAFANTWVMTAITGSDFIDRNQNGLADDEDWGHWVKFNYGHFTSNYTWRSPFTGYQKNLGNTHESYTEGKKQLVYLNSIETRSHVALFLKGLRTDARSAGPENIYPYRLEEIALVTKEQYKVLQTTFGLDYTNKVTSLCTSGSFIAGSAARNYLNLNASKRIILNYDYSLCNGVPNSLSGKLTLKGITIKGRNDQKTAPDYKFEYNSSNPNYNVDKWDGWGLYNSLGNPTQAESHSTPQGSSLRGIEWSLTKISTPIGAEISINYESDAYSSISGDYCIGTKQSFLNSNYYVPYYGSTSFNGLNLNNNGGVFNAGDKVRVSGNVSYKCPSNDSYTLKTYSGIYTVLSATASSLTLDEDFLGIGNCNGAGWGSQVHFEFIDGLVEKILPSKLGGDIRVSSITLTDEFGTQNKIRYLYTKEDGIVSSGSISQEPIYISTEEQDLPPGYPATPVIYGRVAVLNGKLTNDSDYYSKQVYEFETPQSSFYTLERNTIAENEFVGPNQRLFSFENKIVDRTGKIGSLKSVKIFDKDGVLSSSSQITYTETLLNSGSDAFQGIYSSGVLMFDRVKAGLSSKRIKINRTTVLQYPYAIQSILNSKDGFTSESKNLSWDFLTGRVDQKLERSSLGVYIKTVVKPAYSVSTYATMGPKAYDISNRNMLSQEAATYVYRSDALGASLGLVGGSVQTWRNNWSNYRYLNGTTYVESPAEAVSVANPIWRKGPTYSWRGEYSRRQSDGTQSFMGSDEYNFTGSNLLWQYTGEITRFDHFGMPLQSNDMNMIYSSSKMGYDNRILIASATNAKYEEIAFSSAEDEILGTGYFGGEVALKSIGGNATIVRKSTGSDSHTGDCALSLSTGYGFVYKPNTLTTNRKYRISAWTNSPNGRLYYNMGGGEVLSSAPTIQGKTGWYLLKLEVDIGSTFSSLEVGVKSSSGTVLFDDFRFQPADAIMTCYVYPPLDYQYVAETGDVSYVLDNNNQYTKLVTSEDGRTTRVYVETLYVTSINFQGGEKLVSERKMDYRRLHYNQ